MSTVEALGPRRVDRPAEQRWWLAAPALQRAIEGNGAAPELSARYLLGDALLEIASDDPKVLLPFSQRYGDCADSGPVAPEPPRVRCTVRRGGDPPLVLLTFEEGAPSDAAAAAFNFLRPTHATPPYVIRDSPVPGWRLAGGATDPVLAACGPHVLIAPVQVPWDFLVDYLVGITLAAQPDLLPVHGAALCIGDAGVLLIGGSHAGKTTTALHLAIRGHTLLGDELAPIRLATCEILPLRRTVNLRPGPRTPALADAVERLGTRTDVPVDDQWVGPYRIGELFPGSPARPASLRAAFFLGGFAAHASLAPFRLALDDREMVDWLAQPAAAYAAWGLAPERRALRLFALRQLLTRIPCWLLTVGAPGDTAELIERTMEDLRC